MQLAQSTRPNDLDNLPIMAADYTPTDDLRARIRSYEAAMEHANKEKDLLRAAIGHEMLEHPEATTGRLMKHVPWSEETLRGIAREYKVPRKRPPTVRSIKDDPAA